MGILVAWTLLPLTKAVSIGFLSFAVKGQQTHPESFLLLVFHPSPQGGRWVSLACPQQEIPPPP